MTIKDDFKMHPYPVLTNDIYSNILKIAKEGAGLYEIAASLHVPICKMGRWRQIDKKLDETLTMAHTYSGGWWETLSRRNIRDKEFNFNVWVARMNNAYGYGANPHQRTFEVPNWSGNLENKIACMDELLRNGEISVELFEHMMKALESHAKILEICYVKPELEKLELQRKLAANEITQAQFNKEMEMWEESRKIREIAMERVLKREKVEAAFIPPTKRKIKKPKICNAKE